VTTKRQPLRLNALTVGMITRALLDGPHTLYDLNELSGLGIPALRRYVAAMRHAKAAYIAQWEQDSIGRYVMPAFQIGADTKDAKRPPKERIRKRRARAAREAQQAMIQMTAGSVA
jgi:hypothetical protein